MHSVVVRWGSRGILGWNSGAFYMNDNVLYRSWPIPASISMKSYNAGSLPDVE